MFVCDFLGFYEEPPSGEPCAAKRHMLFNPGSGFPMNGLAVVIDPPCDTSPIGSI